MLELGSIIIWILVNYFLACVVGIDLNKKHNPRKKEIIYGSLMGVDTVALIYLYLEYPLEFEAFIWLLALLGIVFITFLKVFFGSR